MVLRTQLFCASIFAAIGVIILAIAAHYLPNLMEESQINSVKTAANIQLLHAVAIFALSNLLHIHSIALLRKAINFMIAGIIFFSGSIYLLSIKTIFNLSWLKIFGPITPIGGILLIISWSIVSFQIYKSNRIND